MAKHVEADFVIPALKALYHLGGNVTMSAIKDEIPKYIDLSEEDMEPFVSRKDKKEARYRQVVGNIISHHNEVFFSYTTRVKEGQIYRFNLNEDGVNYVKSLVEVGEHQNNGQTNYEDEAADSISYVEEGEAYYDAGEPETVHEVKNILTVPQNEANAFDKNLMGYTENHGIDKRRAGDPKIREAVLEICGRKCQYALFTNTIHSTFTGRDGKQYVVGHHLIPMEARKDFFPKNLDRPSNIVCLCPTCHDIIHHGTEADKREILKVLYDNFKDQLNEDGLYISFEKLITKYYL